jgi:hypothetical protein
MEEDREQFKAKHSFAYNSEAFSWGKDKLREYLK